jgi:hypothetical protein
VRLALAAVVALAVSGSAADAAATFKYRVVAASTVVSIQVETEYGPITETVTTRMRTHTGIDGRGAKTAFTVTTPITGDYSFSASGCAEAYRLHPNSTLSVSVSRGSDGLYAGFSIAAPLPAGYATPACRPRTNNALLWHNGRPEARFRINAALLRKAKFTLVGQGHSSFAGDYSWKYAITIVRVPG